MTSFETRTLLVGVGAAKSGTSWLYGYLRDHPQIFMSPVKELHVFDAWFRPDQAEYWNGRAEQALAALEERAASAPTPQQARMLAAQRARVAMSGDLSAYTAYFREQVGPEHSAFGELTPNYSLIRRAGFAALRAQHPRVRLIFLMRDPVERFWSGLRMRQREQPDFSAEAGFPDAWLDERMVERSRYDLTLTEIGKVFPPEEVWTGFYEALFEPETIRALCAWIGVDDVPADFVRRPNRAPEVPLPPEQRATARAMLDPVYAYCRARFGDRLPGAWEP